MKWLENFAFVMRSSITTLREKIEDPERMLHQMIVDMDEELESIRASVAGAIADEILLGKKVERARAEAEEWRERATTAVKRNDDRSAKAALEQNVAAEQRADSLEREYQKQKDETAKLQRAVRDLEDKIRQARQKQTLLVARLARAESSTRINQVLDKAASQSAFAHFGRLEQRVERAEAMTEAYDRLEGRDPDAAELQRQFEETERKERLEKEFEALKRQVAKQA
jgi:phage shock protein A